MWQFRYTKIIQHQPPSSSCGIFNITDCIIMLIFFDWPFPGQSFWGIRFFKAFDNYNLPTTFHLGNLPRPEFTFVHDKIITSNTGRLPGQSYSFSFKNLKILIRFCWTMRWCIILACVSCHSLGARSTKELVISHIYRQPSLLMKVETKIIIVNKNDTYVGQDRNILFFDWNFRKMYSEYMSNYWYVYNNPS